MGLNTHILSYLKPKKSRAKSIARSFVLLIAAFSLVISPYQPLALAEVASNIEDLEECVYGDDICVDKNIEKIKEAASAEDGDPVELSCEGSYGCDRMLDALSEAGGGIVRVWSPQTKGLNDQTFQALNKSEYYQANTCGESSGGGSTLSGGGSGCGGSPEENKKQAWDYFIKKGLTESATAGILGNAFRESGFNPAATNPQGCRGFVQWCFGRNTELDTFAASKGKAWDCLEVQLDYIWYEMMETQQASNTADGRSLGDVKLPDALNGADFPDKALYANSGKSGPYQAASMFHDYFERANTATGEHLGRGESAEDVYRDIVGKDPPKDLESGDSVAGADTSGSSGRGACSSSEGGSLSLECKALVEKFWQLVDEGKIELTDRARQENDMKNCTEDPIECGTGGGKGGVNPYILKAFMEGAMAIQGDKPATVWSFNTGHDCDGLNHPKGRAVDIVCNGNAAGSGVGAEPHCNDMFKYFHEKYEELKLSELIWQYPPKEFSCNDGISLCNIGGHADHIHIGVNPDAGGNQ